MSHIMHYLLAEQLVRDYCCSNCWGHLVEFIEPGSMSRVECHQCGADTPGFVKKNYASRRRNDSFAEKAEVEALLHQIGIIQASKRTAAEVLKDLGIEQGGSK